MYVYMYIYIYIYWRLLEFDRSSTKRASVIDDKLTGVCIPILY